MQNKIVLHFFIQKIMHFALGFVYKKPDTLSYIFIYAKKIHCVLRSYI